MTIAENIGVGDMNSVDNLERVKAAAEFGGAKSFIEKLPEAYETVLKPVDTAWSTRYLSTDLAELKDIMDEVERTKDISGTNLFEILVCRISFSINSGGEKQRLAACVFSSCCVRYETNLNFTSLVPERSCGFLRAM